MWVQGIDPFEAIHELSDLIQAVHLKDTLIHEPNLRLRGYFDSTDLKQFQHRSWTFTIPGWGHDATTWREVISTLRFIGYTGILTLEMESEYIEMKEGSGKSRRIHQPMLLETPSARPGGKSPRFTSFGRRRRRANDKISNSVVIHSAQSCKNVIQVTKRKEKAEWLRTSPSMK